MPKRPSFQFYPGDWRRDAALQSCSGAARGLWIEMMCLMHDGSPYGHLQVGNKRIDPPDLAKMTGFSLRQVNIFLDELRIAEVYSTTEDGVIFCRRMVRDEHVRNERAEAGKQGGSKTQAKINNLLKQNAKQNSSKNPNLLKQNAKQNSSKNPKGAQAKIEQTVADSRLQIADRDSATNEIYLIQGNISAKGGNLTYVGGGGWR